MTNESQIPRIKIRIESLSDLVFGLALSIGSLELIGGKPPQNGFDLALNVGLFGFSFMILVLTWLGYSRTIAVLPVEVPFALFLNLLLLFSVVLEPYLFYSLVSASTASLVDTFSSAYGLDVGAMFLTLAGLSRLLLKEEKNLGKYERASVHPVILKRFRRIMKFQLVIGAIYVISALPIFWIETSPFGFLRFDMWYSSFLFFFGYRPIMRKVVRS